MDFPKAEAKEIRRLLSDFTPGNFAAASRKLDSLVDFVTSAKASIESGDTVDPGLQPFLLELRQEIARVRGLLESAAKFYNGLSGVQGPAGYQRSGLLNPESSDRRTLAQL